MAQAPQPPHKPAAPQPQPQHKPPPLRDPAEGKPPAVVGYATPEDNKEPRPTIGVKGEPIEDGERDPDTIAEEQRRRSDEIQAVGIERWKYDQDTRSEEEKGPFVAAPHAEVEGQRRVEHHESRK